MIVKMDGCNVAGVVWKEEDDGCWVIDIDGCGFVGVELKKKEEVWWKMLMNMVLVLAGKDG